METAWRSIFPLRSAAQQRDIVSNLNMSKMSSTFLSVTSRCCNLQNSHSECDSHVMQATTVQKWVSSFCSCWNWIIHTKHCQVLFMMNLCTENWNETCEELILQLNIAIRCSQVVINDNWKWFSLKHEMETIHHARDGIATTYRRKNLFCFLFIFTFLVLVHVEKDFQFWSQRAWRRSRCFWHPTKLPYFRKILRGKSTFCWFVSAIICFLVSGSVWGNTKCVSFFGLMSLEVMGFLRFFGNHV